MLNGNEVFQEDDLLTLDGCGLDGDGTNLIDWNTEILPEFGRHGRRLGAIIAPRLAVEVDQTDDLGDGTVRTPMMEFGEFDFEYLKQVGTPYPKMQAVSDLGDLYEYDALGGLFKRMKRGFRKLRKRIRKGARRIKKVITKTKFGRAIVKVGGKIYKTAMKVVKPLAKKVGKWATRLAPLAMAIPGVGPAISAGMLAAGGVANAINKGLATTQKIVKVAQKTGKITFGKKLVVKKPAAFKNELKRQATRIKRMPKAELARKIRRLRKMDPRKYTRPALPISKKSMAAAQKLSMLAKIERAKEFAQNRANPARQRQRAVAAARKLIAQNNRANRAAKAAEQRGAYTAQRARSGAAAAAAAGKQRAKQAEVTALLAKLRALGVNIPGRA